MHLVILGGVGRAAGSHVVMGACRMTCGAACRGRLRGRGRILPGWRPTPCDPGWSGVEGVKPQGWWVLVDRRLIWARGRVSAGKWVTTEEPRVVKNTRSFLTVGHQEMARPYTQPGGREAQRGTDRCSKSDDQC